MPQAKATLMGLIVGMKQCEKEVARGGRYGN